MDAVIEAAEAGAWEALGRAGAAFGATATDPVALLEALADALTDRDNPVGAARLDRARLRECERRLAIAPTDASRIALALTLADLGDGASPPDAPALYLRALGALAPVEGLDGARNRALVQSRAGDRAEEIGDTDAAETAYRSAVEALRPQAAGGDPRVLRGLQIDLANLAQLLDDAPEAAALLREAAEMGRRYAASPEPDAAGLADFAEQLGRLVDEAGAPEDAQRLADEAVTAWRRVAALAPGEADDALEEAEALAETLRQLGG